MRVQAVLAPAALVLADLVRVGLVRAGLAPACMAEVTGGIVHHRLPRAIVMAIASGGGADATSGPALWGALWEERSPARS